MTAKCVSAACVRGMAVNMLGAIIPKDISICSVVEEIARQIDHFTRERARPTAARRDVVLDVRVTKTAITLLILVRLR